MDPHEGGPMPGKGTLGEGKRSGSGARGLFEAQKLEHAGEHALALDAYRALLEGGEDGMEVRHGLGCVLHRLGEVDGALENLRLALAEEDSLPSWMGLATIIPGAPSADHDAILSARANLSRRLLKSHRTVWLARPPRRGRSGSKVKVGFLSAFFHRPNYMKPVWGLLNELPREEMEIHLFSDAPGGGEWVGYRPGPEDRIHTTLNLGNEGVARLIRRKELDVLVDLNAYSTPGRIPLLLAPHAPVVMGWFNAFATYGLPGVDVILGDDQVVSRGEEAFFSEEVKRLPLSYLTFCVPYATPPLTPPPVSLGRPFTYGSLAPLYKVTPPVLDLWAGILEGAPGTRLFLANPSLDSLHNRAWVLERFVERGVPTGRIVFGEPGPHETFLGHYQAVDVALDTFPYSGGVTTMEALWQGVPVLTIRGDRWAGRTSRTILHFAELDDWILEDPESLLNRAVEWAEDPKTPGLLTKLRSGLRDRLLAAPVCDTRGAARAFCSILQELLER